MKVTSLVVLVLVLSCQSTKAQLTVTAVNKLKLARVAETIELTASSLAPLGEKDLMKLHVHDAAGPARAHARQHGAPEQHGTAHEEVQLVLVVLPGRVLDGRVRLGAGGVEYQHTDGAQAVCDSDYQIALAGTGV